MSNDSEFKSFILTECLKQSHGDYNVYFSTIIEKYKSKNIEFANSLSVLRLNMMKINGGIEPLLFYPQAETIENIAYKKTFRTSNGEPVVIGIYDSDLSPSYTASGYIIQNDGTLQYHSEITEDFAWENDVWVIGLEEDTNDYSLSYTDLPSFIPVAVNTSLRTQGQAEYAAIIQVTDLNDIEPWTGGKKYWIRLARSLLPIIRAHLGPNEKMVEAATGAFITAPCAPGLEKFHDDKANFYQIRAAIIAALAASPIGDVG